MYRDQAFGTHTSKSVADTSIASINKSSYEQFREYFSHFNPPHSYNRLKKEEIRDKFVKGGEKRKVNIGGCFGHRVPLFMGDSSGFRSYLVLSQTCPKVFMMCTAI